MSNPKETENMTTTEDPEVVEVIEVEQPELLKAAREAEEAPAPGPTPGADEPEVIASGASLAPVIDVPPEQQAHWYWIGLSERCPQRGQVDIAGISFPKFTCSQEPTQDPRVAHLVKRRGDIQRLTRAQLETLAKRLPRTILRMTKRVETPYGGAPRTVWAVSKIIVPTAEEHEKLRAWASKHNKPYPRNRLYTPHPDDKPLADYIYLVYLGGKKCEPRAVETEEPLPISLTGVAVPPKRAEPATTDLNDVRPERKIPTLAEIELPKESDERPRINLSTHQQKDPYGG